MAKPANTPTDSDVAHTDSSSAPADSDDTQDDATMSADATSDDWRHPDYTGPLDISQATWRNAHLK